MNKEITQETNDAVAPDITSDAQTTPEEDTTTETNTTAEDGSIEESTTEEVSPKEISTTESESTTEDNLELHNMKFKDKIKAKRARYKKNTEGMSAGEKIGYFFYYYKWTVLIYLVLLCVAIAVPITIYKKTRPVSISYAVINCSNPRNINTDLFEDYRKTYIFEEPNQIIGDKDVYLSLSEYDENTIHSADSTDYSQFPMLCHNNYYDVIFTDKKGLYFCTREAVVNTLEAGLPTDVYQLLQEEYSDLIVKAPNYNDDMTPFAIDITDTEFAKELNLGYSPVFICFPGNSERNISNSKKMLDYILDLGLDL